jgi:hypothetical protein
LGYILGDFFTNASGRPGTDVVIFKNTFAEKFSEKNWRFLLKLLLVFAKIVIITLVFEINANLFRRKLGKIAENCDHNIDPWQ